MAYVAQKYMTDATSGAGTATLTEHLSSPPVFSGVHVTQYLVLCGMFADHFCPFVLFLLATVLSVVRFTDSHYPFGIFKLFFSRIYFPMEVIEANFVDCIYLQLRLIWVE